MCSGMRHVLCQFKCKVSVTASGIPRNFGGGGGVEQIQLKAEDRETGDLGAVAL